MQGNLIVGLVKQVRLNNSGTARLPCRFLDQVVKAFRA